MIALAPDRKCLITGGANGFGFGIAELLLEAGAQVAIVDTDDAALQSAAAALGPRVATLRADVTKKAEIAQAVEAAADRFGGLDTLVNSAGITAYHEFETITEADWDAFSRSTSRALSSPARPRCRTSGRAVAGASSTLPPSRPSAAPR